jgi:hypothetical protein
MENKTQQLMVVPYSGNLTSEPTVPALIADLDIQIFGLSKWALNAATCVRGNLTSLKIAFVNTAKLLASYGVVNATAEPIDPTCIAATNRTANVSMLSPCGESLCVLPSPPSVTPPPATKKQKFNWVYVVVAVAVLLLLIALALLWRVLAWRRATSVATEEVGKYTVGFIPEADEEVKMAVKQRDVKELEETEEINSSEGVPGMLSQWYHGPSHDERNSEHSSVSI